MTGVTLDHKKNDTISISRGMSELSTLLGSYRIGIEAGNKLIQAEGVWEKHFSECSNSSSRNNLTPVFVKELYKRLDYLLAEWIEKKRPTKAIVRDIQIVKDELLEDDPKMFKVPYRDFNSEDIAKFARYFNEASDAIQCERTRIKVDRLIEKMRETVRTEYPENYVGGEPSLQR